MQKMYHTSNPLYRDSILEKGLTAQTGWSYKYNHGEDVKPAIFLSITYENRFDSTYDDDVYEVDVTGLTIISDVKNKSHVLTYQNVISKECVELIYKGTGRSTF
jgi:hypothetical protein